MGKVFADAINHAINNGGATVGIDGVLVEYPTGYQVSLPDHESTIETGVPFNVLCNAVEMFAGEVSHLMRDEHAIGLWIDGDMFYMDVSEMISDRSEALTMGTVRNQWAIYDWSTGECIECDSERVANAG